MPSSPSLALLSRWTAGSAAPQAPQNSPRAATPRSALLTTSFLWDAVGAMSERRRPAGGASDFDVLQQRARAAVEAAQETVAHSEAIAAVMRLERDAEGLLVRCAWCKRYSLGSEWIEEDELWKQWGLSRKLEAEKITHTICPDCADTSS